MLQLNFNLIMFYYQLKLSIKLVILKIDARQFLPVYRLHQVCLKKLVPYYYYLNYLLIMPSKQLNQ